MVPSMTTILQRFSGEWVALLQTDAILTVCREIGYTVWRATAGGLHAGSAPCHAGCPADASGQRPPTITLAQRGRLP
jgi:hypothetical protein